MTRMGLRWGLLLSALALSGAERTTVTVLATTDLHGNIYPYDYLTGRPAERGLAKIASLVKDARKSSPNVVLLDCGDTIQGSTLEYVYQSWIAAGRLPLQLTFTGPPLVVDPMMQAMNHLGYNAMTVGNHEFNFGLKSLIQARAAAAFPWLGANIRSPEPALAAPYVVKTVGNVKVAIVGITTPAIPAWEKAENIRGYSFADGTEAARRAVAEVRQRHRPELVIVAAHAGLERDPATGSPRPGSDARENMVYGIATQVPGIDGIAFGHSHQELGEARVAGVLLTQPRNWGISLGRMDFALEREIGEPWKVVEKSARVIPVTRDTPADPGILAQARPYHELAERYLSRPVTESAGDLDGALGRIEDSVLVDAIHQVQLHYTKADVSFTALFNSRVRVKKGALTVRQLAALYLYDNDLYAIEGTGKLVREALENAARYFQAGGAGFNPRVIGFNYDMAQGVEYEIDLSQPEGRRVRNLRWKGRPLEDGQTLRIALNNYRAAGSAGYQMFREAPVVWRSHIGIRDLMVEYYGNGGRLPAKPDGNWRIVPDAARQSLLRAAESDTVRPALQ